MVRCQSLNSLCNYDAISRNCQVGLKDAWGNWLTGVGDDQGGWDWWVSLTFRDIEAEGTWTRLGWGYTNTAWNKFVKELAQMQFETCQIGEIRARTPISWVRCRELQKGRGVDHFHALMAGVSDLRRKDAWAWWFENYGIARIEPYNRNLGAGHYLCKYVTKERGDIQFSENLTMR